MTKAILRDPSEDPPAASDARQSNLPIADGRPAVVEMACVPRTAPFRLALDPSGGGIAHWKHEPLREVVEPIHLIYQSKAHKGHLRDYEFGPSAMRTHWQSGLDYIRRTLADPRCLDLPAPGLDIVTHDVHRRD